VQVLVGFRDGGFCGGEKTLQLDAVSSHAVPQLFQESVELNFGTGQFPDGFLDVCD
jgi:hypothetical protein